MIRRGLVKKEKTMLPQTFRPAVLRSFSRGQFRRTMDVHVGKEAPCIALVPVDHSSFWQFAYYAFRIDSSLWSFATTVRSGGEYWDGHLPLLVPGHNHLTVSKKGFSLRLQSSGRWHESCGFFFQLLRACCCHLDWMIFQVALLYASLLALYMTLLCLDASIHVCYTCSSWDVGTR